MTTLEQKAREASDTWREEPSYFGCLRLDAFELGYLAAAKEAEQEIEKLRAEIGKMKYSVVQGLCDYQDATSDYYAMKREAEKLRAELNDWRESARKAAEESCGDEKHCACVGALRHQLVRQAQRIVEPASSSESSPENDQPTLHWGLSES